MEEEIKKRIKAFIRSKDGTIKRFEQKHGLSNGALNNAKYKIPDMVETVKSIYPDMNAKWIMFGDDEDDVSQQTGSPYFDNFSVEGGAASGFGDESAVVPTGYMSVPGVGSDGTIFLRVRGNSMVNHDDPAHSIPDGSLVAVREVKSSSLRWGEVYAFMTIDGPIIKRVFECDDEDCIICKSFNERDGYPPFKQIKSEICGPFYRVTDVVRINHF